MHTLTFTVVKATTVIDIVTASKINQPCFPRALKYSSVDSLADGITSQ